jgi:secondary thiamine-phosphate synthase enzyme
MSSVSASSRRWTTETTTLQTSKRAVYLLTNRIETALGDALRRTKTGIVIVSVCGNDGAKCGITVNEGADPDVRSDMLKAFDAMVREPSGEAKASIRDAVRAALVGKSMVVPVLDGRLGFGTWQALYLAEFEEGGGSRECVVSLCDYGGEQITARRGAVKAPGRGCHLVTTSMPLPKSMPESGVATFFMQHTSASLTINENCDPDVRRDLNGALDRIAPETWHETMFEHVLEGPDDMVAHVKCTLVGPSIRVPVANGRLDAGTWQGLYLNEHRNVGGFGSGHSRDVVCAVDNEPALAQKTITLSAGKRGLRDVTDEIVKATAKEREGVVAGSLHVFCRHTSASVVVGQAGSEFEDAFERALNDICPESWNDEFFRHTAEGRDDMPGHVKSTIVGAGLTLPVVDGKIALGTEGQRVYLCEHRDIGGFNSGLSRNVTLSLQGDRPSH